MRKNHNWIVFNWVMASAVCAAACEKADSAPTHTPEPAPTAESESFDDPAEEESFDGPAEPESEPEPPAKFTACGKPLVGESKLASFSKVKVPGLYWLDLSWSEEAEVWGPAWHIKTPYADDHLDLQITDLPVYEEQMEPYKGKVVRAHLETNSKEEDGRGEDILLARIIRLCDPG